MVGHVDDYQIFFLLFCLEIFLNPLSVQEDFLIWPVWDNSAVHNA